MRWVNIAKFGGHCPLDGFKIDENRRKFVESELKDFYKKPLEQIKKEKGIKSYQDLVEIYCKEVCTNFLC